MMNKPRPLLIGLAQAILLTWVLGLCFCTYSAADGEPAGTVTIEKVLVLKSQRKMQLLSKTAAGVRVHREYAIALGDNPIGHKQKEGDERTPEGEYVIDYRNPQSRYHLSLHINYPNGDDINRAEARGVSPGGDIFIHGLPNGTNWGGGLVNTFDWTDGCIAVTNTEIEEIWALVKNGTPIEIRP